MLCCPSRSPESFSRRLPGGTRRSSSDSAASTTASFLWAIRCTSGEDYRPKLFNQKVLPIGGKDELGSGDYGFAVVNAFTWENKENGKGITFGISMFQKSRSGESLGGGGGGNPDEYFEKIDDEGDAPAETKTGEGAGGLFG